MVHAEKNRRARPSRLGLGHLHDRREMTQMTQRHQCLDGEARDLTRHQVSGNAFERSGVEQTAIDDEFTRARQ